MHEIKCPHCHTAFTVNEAGYADILNQVRTQEFQAEIREREAQNRRQFQSELQLHETQAQQRLEKLLADKNHEISELLNQINNHEKDSRLAAAEIEGRLKAQLAAQEARIAELQQQSRAIEQTKEMEKTLAVTQAVAAKDQQLTELNARLMLQNQESTLAAQTLRERYEYDNSEDLEEYSNAYGEPDFKYAERETLYPQEKRSKTINPDFYHYIPRKCREIYQETDEALSNNLEILAAAGLRALVEAICKDLIKYEDKSLRSLNKKIDFLVEKGHLLKIQSEILHNIRSMGNDSLHEIDKQNISHLNLAMEVLENLLNTLYILPQRHLNNR